MSDQVREAYDEWAATYDEMPNRTRDLDGDRLRTDLGGRELGDVLELGCGTGKNTEWLAPRASTILGLDFSAEMLARCRRRVPFVELGTADLTTGWPVEDRSYDFVLADLVLEHVGDLDHIGSEAARVLRPSGRIRISELHPWRQHEGKGARFERGTEVVEMTTVVHTTEEYVTAFLSAGFKLVSLSEPRSATDSLDRPPRLLIVEFQLS